MADEAIKCIGEANYVEWLRSPASQMVYSETPFQSHVRVQKTKD